MHGRVGSTVSVSAPPNGALMLPVEGYSYRNGRIRKICTFWFLSSGVTDVSDVDGDGPGVADVSDVDGDGPGEVLVFVVASLRASAGLDIHPWWCFEHFFDPSWLRICLEDRAHTTQYCGQFMERVTISSVHSSLNNRHHHTAPKQ